jgi:predicted GNAT family acetyltransferase
LNVVRHHPGSFLARAGAFLGEAEAENNLMLGLAMSLEAGTMTLSATPVLVTLEEDGRVVGAALRTPPHNLVLTRASEAALEALAGLLRREGVALPGVMGPVEAAGRFAKLWAGDAGELSVRQRIYVCEAVEPVPKASGSFRLALADEVDVASRFIARFFHDVGEPTDEHKSRAMALRHLVDGTLFVWDDDGIVSTTLVGGTTPHGIRVFGVYTPPELRRRGYATSCVAAVTQRMLDGGRRFCFLYTDLANPTSNAIYTRIGYRPVCDSALWRFSR